MAKMKAAMAAVLVMEKEGVTNAFGVPGAAINPLYAALRERQSIAHVLARADQCGGRGIVPTGGEDGKYLLEVLEELTFAVGRLQGIPAGQIVQQGLEERPGIAARDVRRAFDQRSEDANLIRERMERR